MSAPEPTLVLLARALREAAGLSGATLRLARDEIDGNLQALATLAILVTTIGVFLVATFFLILDAAVKALAVLIGSEAVAAVVVAAPFLAVTAALGWFGLSRILRATRAAGHRLRREAARLGADAT